MIDSAIALVYFECVTVWEQWWRKIGDWFFVSFYWGSLLPLSQFVTPEPRDEISLDIIPHVELSYVCFFLAGALQGLYKSMPTYNFSPSFNHMLCSGFNNFFFLPFFTIDFLVIICSITGLTVWCDLWHQ